MCPRLAASTHRGSSGPTSGLFPDSGKIGFDRLVEADNRGCTLPDHDLSLGSISFRSGRRFRGAIERRRDRQFPAACALNLGYPQSPDRHPIRHLAFPRMLCPLSGRLHAAGCNMASVCTRAEIRPGRFVTIVGPSRSICSPSASKELLRRGPCQGPYQSSPISGEPSGYQSSGPNVGGGASQRIGPKRRQIARAEMSLITTGEVDQFPARRFRQMAIDHYPALPRPQRAIVSRIGNGPAQ